MYGILAFVGALAIVGVVGSGVIAAIVSYDMTEEEKEHGWGYGEKADALDVALVCLFGFFFLFLLWVIGCVLVYQFHVLTRLG